MLFIFDENYPKKLSEGLNLLEQGNRMSPIAVSVIDAISFMGRRGATDIEIIIAAADKDAIIITHDADFRRIKHYKQFLLQHKVGYIYFKTPKMKGGYHYWDIVKTFVSKWEELKQNISQDTHPFTYEVGKTGGISKCSF